MATTYLVFREANSDEPICGRNGQSEYVYSVDHLGDRVYAVGGRVILYDARRGLPYRDYQVIGHEQLALDTGMDPQQCARVAVIVECLDIEDYLLRKPGQSVDEAPDEAGLDEESLLSRY